MTPPKKCICGDWADWRCFLCNADLCTWHMGGRPTHVKGQVEGKPVCFPGCETLKRYFADPHRRSR